MVAAKFFLPAFFLQGLGHVGADLGKRLVGRQVDSHQDFPLRFAEILPQSSAADAVVEVIEGLVQVVPAFGQGHAVPFVVAEPVAERLEDRIVNSLPCLIRGVAIAVDVLIQDEVD